MPQIQINQALTASQTGFNPVTGWQYEYLPWRAHVKVQLRSTGASNNVRQTVSSGSETIMQRGPMHIGGTAGQIPVDFNSPSVDWIAAAGDRIQVLIDETAGATPNVDGVIYVNPV